MSEESFWTIGFRIILNKRTKRQNIWIFTKFGLLKRLDKLESLDEVNELLRYKSYNEATLKLGRLIKISGTKLIKNRLRKSKIIYVENNTEGRVIISDRTGENGI